MELTISKRDFLKALARTHGVADRKSSMPILSNILLSAEQSDGMLRLSATDLYLGITTVTNAEVAASGTVAVSARTLFDIVKNLPDADVKWTVGPNHSAEIRCGKVKYRIPGMPGDDFPPLPNPGKSAFVELDALSVGQLVTKTQYSMSSDDTRPQLSGALFEGDGSTLRMVTTDGHRLSKAEHQLEADKLDFSMLVPNKGISELRRLIEDIKGGEGGKLDIAMSGGNAFFRGPGVTLSVKLAEERFPPYTKVIPQSASKRIVCPRQSLVDSLKRISLVSSEKGGGGVRLGFEPGLMRIVSENPDIGEGSEELDVDYAGDSLTIGFNAKYLLDVLTALDDDEVALEMSGELDPGVVRPAENGATFVGVVMPMRI